MPTPDNALGIDFLISRGLEPTLVNHTGLWRFLTPMREEKLAPCRKDCPLGNGIPHWMQKLQEDDWSGAWNVMERYNPFPAITGYACYAYCQENCNRSFYDEGLDIRELEKAIGLWKLEQGKAGKIQFRPFEDDQPGVQGVAKSVAVIGSGPAGLSAAYYLNRLGVNVQVFEKLPAAGGLLTTGIPPERLPREILQQELNLLQQADVSFITGVEVIAGDNLKTLTDSFDAVLLTVGAQKRRFLGIPGERLPGVYDALDFLRNLNLDEDRGLIQNEGRFLVIGGGNAALDAASALRRQGAADVWVVYRRGREALPAHESEIKAAEAAGVRFLFHTRPVALCGESALEGVRVIKTRPSRREEELHDLSGSDYTLSCTAVVLAAGSESGLNDLFPQDLPSMQPGVEENLFQILELPAGFSERGNLCLAAGDAATGPQNIALAIAGGRLAARHLLERFYGKEYGQDFFDKDEAQLLKAPPVSYEQLAPYYYPHRGRSDVPREEAERCFSCGLCSHCGICWFFCPDVAVEKESGEYEILLDYCKGCGICAAECPAGVLEMKELKSDADAVER